MSTGTVAGPYGDKYSIRLHFLGTAKKPDTKHTNHTLPAISFHINSSYWKLKVCLGSCWPRFFAGFEVSMSKGKAILNSKYEPGEVTWADCNSQQQSFLKQATKSTFHFMMKARGRQG